MTVLVALNVIVGIVLSVVYISVVGYIWRWRHHWTIVVPVLNAAVYVLAVADYIGRATEGDPTVRPISWTILVVILPAVQVAMLLYWSTRDMIRGEAIAAQAQVYTDEANQRADDMVIADVAERNELASERTAAATERIAAANDQQADERADDRAADKLELRLKKGAPERTAAATERLADAAEHNKTERDGRDE